MLRHYWHTSVSPKFNRPDVGGGMVVVAVVVVGISSIFMCQRKSVHCQCSAIAVQIYVSVDIASGRGFVARLQISIKFKLLQFGGRMRAGSAHGTASHEWFSG
jgi:hypothetical protein